MANDKSLDTQAQMLAAQLDALRKDLYKLIDNTIANIARTCAGISPDAFQDVVTSIFQPNAQSGDKNMAGAAPTMATDVPSPKTDAGRIGAPQHRGRCAVWANSSDGALRTAYSKRIRAGKEIEPELESELIKRFPGYDAETHKFTGRGRKVKTDVAPSRVATPVAGPQLDNDIVALTRLSSPQNKNGKYPLRFDGETILLRGADRSYELVLFDKKTKYAVVRKEFDDRRYKLFIIKCKKGQVLQDMRTGARDIRYIPETHQLLAREMPTAIKRFMVYTPGRANEMWDVAPDGAISITAQKILKETIVIEEDGRVTTYPLINLACMDKAKAESAPKRAIAPRKPKTPETKITPTPVAAPAREQKIEQPAPVPEQKTVVERPSLTPVTDKPVAPVAPRPVSQTVSKPVSKPDLVVTMHLTKMSLDAAFYDVFVNGKRILKNHIDTEVRLFLGGTVLGVHGRVTDIDDFPDTPSWQIYDTNLKRRDFSYVNTFSKKKVFIKDVKLIGDSQIVLEVSNKMRVILDKKNAQQVFKIGPEKTK